MRINKYIVALMMVLISDVAKASLVVNVSKPKLIGQKWLIKLTMTNTYTKEIRSARAAIFLFDKNEKLVGQKTCWPINDLNERGVLKGDSTTIYNVVISSRTVVESDVKVNLNFSRILLGGGELKEGRNGVEIKYSNE